jgi:hypothetical protein
MTCTASRRALLVGLLASSTGVPAMAAPTPSAIATACDWGVRHLDWIRDSGEPVEAWPDVRLEAELDRVDEVLFRVAEEPSACRQDLTAKARLVLASVGECMEMSDLHIDRATLRLLREVVALCA